MGNDHLSRLAAPKSWPIERKLNKWIYKQIPGPHSIERGIPLSVLIRDMLGHAKTSKEIKLILNQGDILVDRKIRKEEKFPVGFMDVIEIPRLGEAYRLLYDLRGVFSVVSAKKEQSSLKILRILNKSIIKKGLIQVTLHDGRNISLNKFEGSVGDAVLFDLDDKKIKKVFSLENGCLVYLNGGKHVGRIGRVKSIIKPASMQEKKVVCEMDGKEYITLAKYALVVGKEKPEIDLEIKK